MGCTKYEHLICKEGLGRALTSSSPEQGIWKGVNSYPEVDGVGFHRPPGLWQFLTRGIHPSDHLSSRQKWLIDIAFKHEV